MLTDHSTIYWALTHLASPLDDSTSRPPLPTSYQTWESSPLHVHSSPEGWQPDWERDGGVTGGRGRDQGRGGGMGTLDLIIDLEPYSLLCVLWKVSLYIDCFAQRSNKDKIRYGRNTLLFSRGGIVLYFTVLYCIVLYCTILYYTVLLCTVLYCTVHCTVQYTYKEFLYLSLYIVYQLIDAIW